ncbi:hypothetical protein FF1_002721 [Malus domestica]
MRNFNYFIRETELKDLEMHNAQFTWSNFREEPMCRKPDRFLFSVGCEEIFPEVRQMALARVIPDHYPIQLDSNKVQRWSKESFREVEKDFKEAEANLEELDKREGMEGLDVDARRKRE